MLQGLLRARYGVISRLQVDATVPFVYARANEVLGVGSSNTSEFTTDGHGLGDVEFGISGQPLIGRGWIPNVLTRVSVRIPTGKSAFDIPTVQIPTTINERRLSSQPTGAGFYQLTGTVTAVWSIDPVVLFAGAGYIANLPASYSGFGDIDPGDGVNWFAGLNFALNERVSFNFSFNAQRNFSTTRNGVSVINTAFTDARVILGTSIGVARNVNVTFNAGIGLTTQSPNFTFTIGVPFTFDTPALASLF